MASSPIRDIRAQLRQFHDAAVAAGYPPSQFTCLKDLLEPHVIEKAFREIAARIGKKTPATLGNIMATLVAIARHHVGLPEDELRPLRSAKAYYFKELDNGARRCR